MPAAALPAKPPTSLSAASPTSVAVADFNGDQDPDLAVANGFGTVSVLLGGSGASFTRQPDIAIGGTPWSVAVGDFNARQRP